MRKQGNLIIIIIMFFLLTGLCELTFNILNSTFAFFLGNNISAILSGIIVLVSCIFLLYHYNIQTKYISFKLNSFPYLFISILSLISFNLIYSNTLGLIDFTFGPFNIIRDNIENIEITFYQILSFCVLGPIIEEYFFRVLILNKLMSKYSTSTSIVLSAFIFGLVHFNYNQFVKAFLIALLLGFIYNHSKSYILVCILHILNNSFYLIRGFIFTDYVVNEGFQLLQLILGIILGVGVLFIFKSKKFGNSKSLV